MFCWLFLRLRSRARDKNSRIERMDFRIIRIHPLPVLCTYSTRRISTDYIFTMYLCIYRAQTVPVPGSGTYVDRHGADQPAPMPKNHHSSLFHFILHPKPKDNNNRNPSSPSLSTTIIASSIKTAIRVRTGIVFPASA